MPQGTASHTLSHGVPMLRNSTALLWSLALSGACSTVEVDPVCAPGLQTYCPCAGSSEGIQTCKADGSGFEACSCGSGGSGQGGSGEGGGTSTGGGGSAPCNPGESTPCYTGPQGTEDVGVCLGGISTCNTDGTAGTCVGEIVPTLESCVTVQDEDCDGSSPACNTLWSKSFATNSDFTAKFVGTDALGNVYVAGSFTGMLNLGGTTLLGLGTEDIFVAKLDSGGSHLWSKSFGDPIEALGNLSFDVDAAGRMALAGYFVHDLNLGGTALTANNAAFFLGMLDTNGNTLWAKAFETGVYGISVALDANGGPRIFAQYDGSVFFGGTEVHSGSGTNTSAQFDVNGDYVSSVGFSFNSVQFPVLDLAPDGDTVVLGRGNGGDLGGGFINGPGPVVARFGPDYAHVFSKGYSNSVDTSAYAIAAGASNEVAIVLNAVGTYSFDGNMVTAQNLNGLVVVYEPNGAYRFARFPGGGQFSDTKLAGVRVAALGEIVTAGSLFRDADFGGGATVREGATDALVLRLSATGSILDVLHYGGAETTTNATALAVAPDGTYIIAGRYDGTATSTGPDFGQGALPSTPVNRAFLARVAP